MHPLKTRLITRFLKSLLATSTLVVESRGAKSHQLTTLAVLAKSVHHAFFFIGCFTFSHLTLPSNLSTITNRSDHSVLALTYIQKILAHRDIIVTVHQKLSQGKLHEIQHFLNVLEIIRRHAPLFAIVQPALGAK